MKALLNNRVFMLILGSDLLQQMGIWIRNMAMLFFVMDMTGNDPVAVSLLTVIEYAPIFLFSFLGGALADRWNPKRAMITGDLLSALSVVAIMAVLATGWWPAVFAVTFVSSVVSQFSQPASAKAFKRNVPDELIGTAIGITQTLQSLFLIIGPAIGTLIYVKVGIEVSLYSLIALFLLSALLLSLLPRMESSREREEGSTLAREFREGYSYVRRHGSLLPVMGCFALVGLGTGLTQPLEVFLLTERLGLGKEHLQWFTALYGVGMLLGGALAASIAPKLNVRRMLMIGLLFESAAIVIEAISTSILLTASLRFVTAVLMAVVQITLSMFMVKEVEEAYIGRVNGLIAPVLIAMVLVGSSVSGLLMQATSLIFVYTLAGIFIALSLLPASRLRSQSNAAAVAAAEDPGKQAALD
ncbi:MFS transporter [Paenibacillus sp. FJAT-26967]|uniref:MFS transporter n=1 Tax=Paenibacillus sp. FJAT-26967 TaxID=1729690 RepID=UPI0008384324|nr:MFS transporter [Paenibacillus sp. FJAT-26967]